ncbi:NADH dehydrogenase [ubiquinone] 1 alpha subcomplex subunit 11 [Bombyx mandarina]|uniref:NADH dehydrogenase [ubiquinone] 1 alpha subcomplex subunit 11 n=2 Tax=Bombyx TaxID=7090 RepID=A0A8R2M3Z5_BOMMO|nr:NADH dehydrogenase [ubiquinone] 1 alpha subcomplex subunit 11 [Bombyx mandarina]XP_037873417.1 NADH dehydrogenase [ubiquinone] 1 alpha subcomplex subunit 11 [Bombyx mori]
MNKLLNYKYYDTPEGQDIFMKTFVTSKYAAVAGLAGASFDVLMFSHPKGFVNTIGRMGYIVGPLVGMAVAFTFTTNVAQNIRGKNDKLNYFLGGATSGFVFSAWMKKGIIAVPAAVVLGAIAVVKKTGIDEGWIFFPDAAQSTKTIKSVKHDWTLLKDIEELKGWTDGSKQ